MKKQRKHYTPEEKVAILRRHLVEGVPISDLCDERGLQPTVFYRWQKEFFENGAAAFQQRGRTNHQPEQERIAYLEKKIGECIRPGTPLSLGDARRLVKGYVEHYNNVRLNSAIGYITPTDMLAGHQQEIQAERDRKLETAREQRKNRRWAA